MIKGVLGIVGLAVLWGVGCGTHSGIGNLGTGGNGSGGTGGTGTGGVQIGMGGEPGTGGALIATGGNPGAGGAQIGMGGEPGTGGFATGGQPGTGCPGVDAGAPPTAPAKTLAFSAPVDYPTGFGAMAVAAGDLNGDHKIDLVLLDQTAGARVMLNNGDGTFGGPVDHALVANPIALALGDLNGDGLLDVASVSNAGVSVILNQGNAAFGPPLTYVVGTNSQALALGDLNSDGRLDIAVVDGGSYSPASMVAGDVGILLNTGGGTFSARNYGTLNQPAAIALGDVNEDCQLDLIVADADGLTLLSSSFGLISAYTQSHIANGTSGQSVAIADLNGDGRLDLFEGDRGLSVSNTGYVLLNLGLGAFTAPVRYSALDGPDASLQGGSSLAGVAAADLNGDGKADLLSIGVSFSVFLSRGSGTFATPSNFSLLPYPTSLAHGDFNGDGLEDVAVVSYNGGQFQPASSLRVLINASH